jgi:hypothetical protein
LAANGAVKMKWTISQCSFNKHFAWMLLACALSCVRVLTEESAAHASGISATGATVTLPPAWEVLKRVIARAETNAEIPDARQYHYQKRSVFEEFGSDGRLLKSTEKIYAVKMIGGQLFDRLIKIQGKELSPSELAREDERENQFRHGSSRANSQKTYLKENWLSRDLLDRFEFTTVKRDFRLRRPFIVISFKPSEHAAPAKTVQDKICGRLTGSIWVDELDAETAELNVNLTAPLSLGWFGSIGSIHQCDLSLVRSRMPDGIWVDKYHEFKLAGRRLFTSMRYHITEESSDFKKP